MQRYQVLRTDGFDKLPTVLTLRVGSLLDDHFKGGVFRWKEGTNRGAGGRAAAIVNAANPWMLSGGGISGKIYKAAGPGLEAYVKTIKTIDPRTSVKLQTGDAIATESFKLKEFGFTHIIHTVVPNLRLVDQETKQEIIQEPTPDDEREYATAVNSVLFSAHQLGVRRVAFPLLGGDIYAWPAETCAEILVTQLIKSLATYPMLDVVIDYIDQEKYGAAFNKAIEGRVRANDLNPLQPGELPPGAIQPQRRRRQPAAVQPASLNLDVEPMVDPLGEYASMRNQPPLIDEGPRRRLYPLPPPPSQALPPPLQALPPDPPVQADDSDLDTVRAVTKIVTLEAAQRNAADAAGEAARLSAEAAREPDNPVVQAAAADAAKDAARAAEAAERASDALSSEAPDIIADAADVLQSRGVPVGQDVKRLASIAVGALAQGGAAVVRGAGALAQGGAGALAQGGAAVVRGAGALAQGGAAAARKAAAALAQGARGAVARRSDAALAQGGARGADAAKLAAELGAAPEPPRRGAFRPLPRNPRSVAQAPPRGVFRPIDPAPPVPAQAQAPIDPVAQRRRMEIIEFMENVHKDEPDDVKIAFHDFAMGRGREFRVVDVWNYFITTDRYQDARRAAAAAGRPQSARSQPQPVLRPARSQAATPPRPQAASLEAELAAFIKDRLSNQDPQLQREFIDYAMQNRAELTKGLTLNLLLDDFLTRITGVGPTQRRTSAQPDVVFAQRQTSAQPNVVFAQPVYQAAPQRGTRLGCRVRRR